MGNGTVLSSADVSFFLMGGKDVLGFSTRINHSTDDLTGRLDSLGDDFEYEGLLGITRTNVQQNGFYTQGAAGALALIRDRGRTRMGGAIGIEASALGSMFIAWSGQLVNQFQIEMSREDWVHANAQMNAVGLSGDFLTIVPFAEYVGPLTSAVLDNDVATTNGGLLACQVTDFTANGATGLTVTFEHSATGVGAWVTLGSHIFTADGDYFVAVTGDVEQYTRVTHAWAGGTLPAATTVAGISRHQDLPV